MASLTNSELLTISKQQMLSEPEYFRMRVKLLCSQVSIVPSKTFMYLFNTVVFK